MPDILYSILAPKLLSDHFYFINTVGTKSILILYRNQANVKDKFMSH